MTMQTDVSAASIASSDTAVAYRTRVRGLVIAPGSANGTVILKDGGSSGTTLATIDITTDTTVITAILPGNGIRFTSSIYVTLPTSATITGFIG